MLKMRCLIGFVASLFLIFGCQTSPQQPEKVEAPKQTNPIKEEVEYYQNGVVKMEGRTIGGERIGKWESYYPNGYKWSEMNYSDGKRNGPMKSYFKNGIMRYQGFYEADERVGVWQYYDTTGTLIQKIDMDTLSKNTPLPL